jgi:glycosyltransferase involved in cell wall biosynthesis
LKVAIVHPWFCSLGGGEKVIEEIATLYPQAHIFALVSFPEMIPPSLQGREIHTTFLNAIPGIRKIRQELMVLYPTAIESMNLSAYDLVISSAGPVTFGVNVRQDATHICYFHSPGRSWWDQYAQRQESLSEIGKLMYTLCATYVRSWEFSAAQRIDHVLANSYYIAHRVHKYLRRTPTVIYPPVDTFKGYLASKHDDYFLSLGRLEKRKCLDLVVRACNRLGRRLIIAGVGPEEKSLKKIAGKSIEFCGRVSDNELRKLYANCRAFLFAADEDFGIVTVEAQSYGRPIIAYGHGGSLETVRINDSQGRSDTGVFFPEQTVESVVEGILRFERQENAFLPAKIQEHSRQFDTTIFACKIKKFIDVAMAKDRNDFC